MNEQKPLFNMLRQLNELITDIRLFIWAEIEPIFDKFEKINEKNEKKESLEKELQNIEKRMNVFELKIYDILELIGEI